MINRIVAGEHHQTGARSSRARQASTTLATAIALALAAQAGAQTAAAPSASQLEEIVVTAERRESNLQSTPIAISALSENLIKQESPRTIADLAMYVPNFSANKINGFNAASFAMRGVGNTDIIVYNEAPVAVLVDDFVMPSVQTQLLDAFDVQQVEVLRGPQGTLFGKNTTGGAVVVRTKAPKLNELSFEAQAQAGNFNAFNAQAAINLPLVSDRVSARIVVSSEKEDGWIHNGGTNTIPAYTGYGGTYNGDGKAYGGTEVLTARGKLLWQITDDLKTQATYEMVRDRSQAPIAVNETPADLNPATGKPYFVFQQLGLPGYTGGDVFHQGGTSNRDGYLINMPSGHRVDVDGMYLNTEWKLAPGTVTWVQGYRSQDSSLPSNYTGVVGPLSVFDANRSDRRKTWQEEVRFASNNDGPFNYVVGAFYQHDDTKFCVSQILGIYDLFGVPTPAGAQPGGYNNNPQVLCNAQTERSKALFGEGNFKLSDKLTLTFGARYTEDNKDWIGRQQVFVQQLNSTGAFNPAFTYRQLGDLMSAADFNHYSYGVVTDNHSWSVPTYRASLSYQFNRDLFGYGTYSHGFRAGGYNDQVGTSGVAITEDERKPTNPEKADSFEVGVKAELADRRIRLNEALFYVQYKDAIRQVVVPVTNANGKPGEETLFRNAAKLTVYGIENELEARVTDAFTVRVPLSYQHCKYNNFSSGSAATGDYVDLSGLDVNRCPTWTATLSGNYSIPVQATGGTVILDASANYVSKNLDTYSIALPYSGFTQTYADARTLVNASVMYRDGGDRWFVRALARNLTDRTYKTSAQNVDPLWVWSFYGEPRYYGLEIGVKFADKR
jgi:iron complex outermembrane recepter protein